VALTGHRTFVGFGFGAIQAGLFLYEAYRSGGFARLVVAEVVVESVEALRRNRHEYSLNIAHADRVERARVGQVEIENPSVVADLARLVDAVAESQEISTAVPSVNYYVGSGPGSIHRILAEGLRKKAAAGGPRAVVYAAENHNHAAEILAEAVFYEIPAAERAAARNQVCFLNTVIGKMSGIIDGADEVQAGQLAPITRLGWRAFLVESFNRILISQVRFPEGEAPFERGISAFIEKPDLLPFEEAKLYGHNATHALAAYLGALRGLATISDLHQAPDVLELVCAAFLEESGEALIRKHAGKDRLFTPEGFAEYADDLIERMTNPHLHDSVDRVGRDPGRKLGWDDRLVGTMRLALQQNLTPRRFSLGAAAALAALDVSFLDLHNDADPRDLLAPIWGREAMESDEAPKILSLIDEAKQRLKQWQDSGFKKISLQ
jgi:mannitol-1-phosphate 5-dehydrogenase